MIATETAHNLDTLESIAKKPKAPVSEGQDTLRKRAFKKYDTLSEVEQILDACPESPLRKRYLECLDCNAVVLQDGYHIKASFCNYAKECSVCRSRKIAERINYYRPILETFTDLYFITLTRRSEANRDSVDDLKAILREFNHKCHKTISNVRYRHELKGIKAIETNANMKRKSWHVHAHILVEGKAVAEAIKSYWLKHNPTATPENQVIKKADINTITEVIKYVTKSKIGSDGVTPEVMDKIYQATNGAKLFNSFGLSDLKPEQESTYDRFKVKHKPYQTEIYVYAPTEVDWLSAYGDHLAEHDPKDKRYRKRKHHQHEKSKAKKRGQDLNTFDTGNPFRVPKINHEIRHDLDRVNKASP